MKKSTFFTAMAAIILSLAMLSCSSDDAKNEGGNEWDGSYSFFALKIATPSSSGTRAPGTDEGSNAETKVNEVYVVLYDTSTGDVNYQIAFTNVSNSDGTNLGNFNGSDVATGSGVTTPSETQFTTVARMVQSKNYNMIVLVNPTAAMKANTAVSGGQTHDQFVAAQNVPAVSALSTDGNFVMINASGAIAVSSTQLKASKQAAEQAPIVVKVDRIVAKVESFQDDDFVTTMDNRKTSTHASYKFDDWDAASLSWKLDQENQYTYYIRRGFPSYAAESGLDRSALYATDPNMTVASLSGAPLTASFIKPSISQTDIAATWNALNLSAASNSVYTLENTMDATTQGTAASLAASATHVIVKLRIAPIGMTLGNGYYSYNGTVFTHADAIGWYTTGFPSWLPKATLEASSFFTSGATSTEPTVWGISNGICYHWNSWNVYRVAIQHVGGTGQLNPGSYGVVRNNWYKINVEDISGPGTGASDKYIAAQIMINPWIVRDPQNVSW